MKIEFELSGRKVVAIVIGALVLWFAGWQMTRLVQTSEGRVMPKRGNVPQVASFPGSEVVNDEKVVEIHLMRH